MRHLAEDAAGCHGGGTSAGSGGMLQLPPEKRQHSNGEMWPGGVHPHDDL